MQGPWPFTTLAQEQGEFSGDLCGWQPNKFIYRKFSISFFVRLAVVSHILADSVDLIRRSNVLDGWRLSFRCCREQSKKKYKLAEASGSTKTKLIRFHD